MGNPNDRTPMPGYGADLAAPIWNDYMTIAATEPCDDFPEPKDPASLSPGYGSHTVSSDYGETSTLETTDTTTDEETDGADPEGNAPPDGFDDDLYAPGAGQEPLPTPGNGNGNNGNGNGNGGGGTGPRGGISP